MCIASLISAMSKACSPKAAANQTPIDSPNMPVMPQGHYVSWTIRYRKSSGRYTYGRTCNLDIARTCEENGWLVQPGAKWQERSTRDEILAARIEADVEFDGGWNGDCTRGCELNPPIRFGSRC